MFTTHKVTIDHDRLIVVNFEGMYLPFVWSVHPGEDVTLEHNYSLQDYPFNHYPPILNAEIDEDVVVAEDVPVKWLTWQRTDGANEAILYLYSKHSPIIFDRLVTEYVPSNPSSILARTGEEVSLSCLIDHDNPELFRIEDSTGAEIIDRQYKVTAYGTLTVTIFPPNDTTGTNVTVQIMER